MRTLHHKAGPRGEATELESKIKLCDLPWSSEQNCDLCWSTPWAGLRSGGKNGNLSTGGLTTCWSRAFCGRCGGDLLSTNSGTLEKEPVSISDGDEWQGGCKHRQDMSQASYVPDIDQCGHPWEKENLGPRKCQVGRVWLEAEGRFLKVRELPQPAAQMGLNLLID